MRVADEIAGCTRRSSRLRELSGECATNDRDGAALDEHN